MPGKTAKSPRPDGYGNFAHQHNQNFPLYTTGPTVLTNGKIGSHKPFFSNAKGKKVSSNERNKITKRNYESVFGHEGTNTCPHITNKCLSNLFKLTTSSKGEPCLSAYSPGSMQWESLSSQSHPARSFRSQARS